MSVSAAIELNGGLLVQLDALLFAWELERRGHVLNGKDGVLTVTRGSELSADDRRRIRELKNHLLAIAGYRWEIK